MSLFYITSDAGMDALRQHCKKFGFGMKIVSVSYYGGKAQYDVALVKL